MFRNYKVYYFVPDPNGPDQTRTMMMASDPEAAADAVKVIVLGQKRWKRKPIKMRPYGFHV